MCIRDSNIKEASFAVDEIFNGKFGEAKNILVEEFLDGEEMSFFIISDGNTFKTFGTAQDHKRVLEGDKGKNTGGMGAYSPSRLINKELEIKILDAKECEKLGMGAYLAVAKGSDLDPKFIHLTLKSEAVSYTHLTLPTILRV